MKMKSTLYFLLSFASLWGGAWWVNNHVEGYLFPTMITVVVAVMGFAAAGIKEQIKEVEQEHDDQT